jgi:hypothetical protein
MKRTPILAIALALAAALFVVDLAAVAQDLHPSRRPSPMGMARTDLGDAYVRVVYSRPYLRGRDNIFGTEESGALVPFGKVWRTGANEGTELTVTKDVKVAGETLPAGTYTLFTTPGPESWGVHINSLLGFSGTFRRNAETGQFENAYDAANNVVDVTVKPGTLEEEADQFTIVFEEADGGVHLVLRWQKTEVRVPIQPAS